MGSLTTQCSELAEALQIHLLVGHPAGALSFPEGLGERLQHGVLGGVAVAEALGECLVDLGDAGGAVGGDLLADGEVKAHVEEGVLAAGFGGVVGG